jgi:dTDP-glucose 4,6-dehydratase
VGTHNALELSLASNARFMLASTSEVYGDPLVHPQQEDYKGNVSTTGKRSVYDEAKRYAEAVTMAYHRHHGLETRIVRIFNTYGPRMREDDGRMVPNFIQQALAGEPLTVYGEGTQTRSVQYVDDLIEGVTRLMRSGETRPVNIGNPVEYSVSEVAAMIIELSGSDSEISHQPLPEDDPKQRRPDITRARNVLGWEPQTGASEGLAKTLAWFAPQSDAAPATRRGDGY